VAALAAVALFVALIARFWHPVYGFTSLIQLDAPNDELKITAFRELPVFVHRDNGGYDGLYYAQIAHDPTLRDPASAAGQAVTFDPAAVRDVGGPRAGEFAASG
jgi:hypothetical protein